MPHKMEICQQEQGKLVFCKPAQTPNFATCPLPSHLLHVFSTPHALAVQVCDFNLARALKTDTVEPSATLNSPAWSAPERLQGKRYGKSADVFSFGVILWELITLGKLCTHHADPRYTSKPKGLGDRQLDPHFRL